MNDEKHEGHASLEVDCFSCVSFLSWFLVFGSGCPAVKPPMGWKNSNFRTAFMRLLRRAGVPAWPRLFPSMRASRQPELQREFPIHVVCSWLGNSP
ncbi:MAG: hypothetical protein ACK5OB_00790 [Pirellula sp.]